MYSFRIAVFGAVNLFIFKKLTGVKVLLIRLKQIKKVMTD